MSKSVWNLKARFGAGGAGEPTLRLRDMRGR